MDSETVRAVPWSDLLGAWPAWAFALCLSSLFYRLDNPDYGIRRLVAAAHGFLLAAALCYSVVAGAFTWDPWLPDAVKRGIEAPFHILVLLSLLSIFASFALFRGPRALLLLHVVTLPLLFFIYLAGATNISHISL
jgi:hypothetical protein